MDRPTNLLAHFRRLFATFTVLVAVLLVIQLPAAPVAGTGRAVAAGAAMGVVGWSVLLWRRRPPLVVVDALLLTLLSAIAWAMGDAVWIYSLIYVSLYQRALEGTMRRTMAFAVVLFAVWRTLVWALTPGESTAAGAASMLAGVLFSAYLLQTIRRLVERQARMVAREVVLTEASRQLLDADDLDEVASIAAAAGAQLPGSDDTTASVWRVEGEELVKIAAVNPPAEPIERLPFTALPPDVLASLQRGEPYRLDGELARRTQRQAGGSAPYATLLVAPLSRQGDVSGVVLITAVERIDDDALDVLRRFADGVTLAQERVELAAGIAERERRFATVVANSSDVIMLVDPTGVIELASDAARHSFGLDPDDLAGRNVFSLVEPDDLERVRDTFAGQDGPSDTVRFDCQVRNPEGELRDVEVTANLLVESGESRFVVNVRDVTERRQLEAQLSFRAFHDPVTGLANRSLFADRTSHAIASTGRDGRAVAVALIDLDDFKQVNDSLGHEAGDQLLVTVAERLREVVRAGDTPARFGGDEFAILLDDVGDAGEAMLVLQRVLAALERPVTLAGRSVGVRASIGVAVGGPSDTPDSLLRDADAAMYVAKNHGKHRVELFRPEMHASVLRRLELRSELQAAIARDELEVHYQPLVDLHTGAPVSLEALLRWTHPERGAIGPDEFIPIAEQSGFIVDLGRWVLRRACDHVAGLGDDTLGLSVNVSALQLRDPALVDDVAAALAASGLSSDRLLVEVTETAILEDPVVAGQALRRIRDLGVRIAVDDFGTGHSSLLHLQHLPIDVLKVDRIFVKEASTGSRGARLVRAIERLAAVLELDVVAEGVETEEQAAALRALGYGLAQGFLYARAMPAEELPAWLDEVRGRPPAGGVGTAALVVRAG